MLYCYWLMAKEPLDWHIYWSFGTIYSKTTTKLTLPATGSRFRGCHRGGGKFCPPSKSMLEALLRGMMEIVIDCHIILGPHEKNQDQIWKIGRFMDNFRFFLAQVKKNFIGQKWPPFGQISIFWALVFCKHPYFYSTNGLCNKNIGL